MTRKEAIEIGSRIVLAIHNDRIELKDILKIIFEANSEDSAKLIVKYLKDIDKFINDLIKTIE